MKKNILYLSPNFPTNFKSFSVALKKAGARVFGLGDEPYHQLSPALKEVFTEYYKVSDLHNYDELIRACGYFTHKYGKIYRLDSLNEYWLDTEAVLRDDFNIYGMRKEDTKIVRSKSEMKKIYKKAGLRVAKGKIVRSLSDAKKFIEKVGYPVVTKPDSGVGAVNTYKINNEEELIPVFDKIDSKTSYIMEEFITGVIHSYDGLADNESNPIFSTSHIFSQGVMETVNDDMHIYYYSVRDIPKALEAAGKKCLKAFNVKERFFHLEFFYTPKGEFIPLEVNIRPPGGLTIDMMNYSCDVDLFEAWAELLVHGKTDLAYDRKYFCLYAGRKNSNSYTHTHREILDKFGEKIVIEQEIPAVFRNALGDYAYILRSPDFDEVQKMTDYIQQLEA